MKIDKNRNKTPEFLKRKENFISQKSDEKFLDFNSKIEIEMSDEEDNTKSSNFNNKKIIFKKNKKNINNKENERRRSSEIDMGKKSGVCCSAEEIKEKCLIF